MKQEGFSLMELLVVIAIIGVLAAVALPRFSEFRAAAYDASTEQDLHNLAAAEELYRAKNDSYASDLATLSSFRGSQGVVITIESADGSGFRATARHPSGRTTYVWDSNAEPALSTTP